MHEAVSAQRVPTPWLRLQRRRDGSVEVRGTPSAVFGHQVERNGAERPGGVYVEWTWDGQQLTVRNDRTGLGQLLYATLDQGEGIALSPHMEHLLELGADRQIDDQTASILIRIGFLLDIDTPYRAVKALPPNATLTWRPGDLQVDSRLHIPPPIEMDRDAAVDRYVELFRQSMARRPSIPGRTVVPLTGGQDSRHIVFELCQRGTPPEACVTVRPYRRITQDDLSVASAITARLGIHHEKVTPARSLVAEDTRKYQRLGPISDEGGWASAMWDTLASYGCAYDGIAGDMLSSGYLAGIGYDQETHDLVARRDWGRLADLIVDHFAVPEQAMAPLLRHVSFQDQGRTLVRERVIDRLETVAESAHPLGLFMIYNRTRREIAMMSWLLCSRLSPYYAPYTDEDLFDFLASLPAGQFAVGGWFHRAAIAKGYPQWQDLPYLTKGDAVVPVSAWEAIRSIGEINLWTSRTVPALIPVVARWGLQRLWTRAGRHTAPRRVVQHVVALEQMFRRHA